MVVAPARTGVLDAVLPRRRVVPVAVLLVAATFLDSAATYAWVRTEVAVEGNPLVAAAMRAVGDGPALAVRALLSGGLVLALATLARRYREARRGLLVAGIILAGVTGVHAYGVWLVTRGLV